MIDTAERAFFRVEARLPLRQEIVAGAELDALRRELERATPAPDREAFVIERLEAIEQKLDRVLTALDPSSALPVGHRDLRDVSLSGSGVRYVWPEHVAPGTEVKLQLRLPGYPSRLLRCIARVVDCPPHPEHPGEHCVATEFVQIHEADRDAIVRYTLEVQRDQRSSARSPEPS